ncbi:MAG: ATP-binding cassette domain-containing protein, partial [Alphaproteobacteria bacterium]
RRAALAQAIVTAPDVLLLDEPTNHLDLPTILWLEAMLTASRTTILMISHDQAFLRAVTQRTFWVRRGQVLSHPRGYEGFDAWADEVQAEEDNRQAKLNQHIKAETHWLIHGVTARRRRNQGRLQRLDQLRAERATLLSGGGKAALGTATGRQSGKLVIEAKDLHKSFDGLVVVDGFSTRIARGERIGFIGPNGAGKTTLLNMLTGRLEPDQGSLRLGTKLDIAVFDQKRQALDPNATLWQTLVEGGGDSLMVHGRQKHVVAYLRDFLFDDRQAKSPVHTLSGGERNRLLLAKILARPSNLLVLDEPTNDLDADTLALLQDMLDKYDGTLLLVSHDRDFLDHMVHSTIVLEGGGIVQEFAGGYSDYLQQRGNKKNTRGRASEKPKTVPARTPGNGSGPRKLSFQENRELEGLPGRIEALSAAKADLEAALAGPELYVKDPGGAGDLAAKLKEITGHLAAAEDRWLALESLQESLARSKPS